MKRANPYAYRTRPGKRMMFKRTGGWGNNGTTHPALRRAYPGSMVPLRSGGYKPNRIERKVNDLTTNTYQVNTTGSIVLIANPILGSDFNNRIGRKITLKSVYIRGYIAQEGADGAGFAIAAPTQLGRMILVADLQPNGAVPAITDILVEATSCSQLNLNNRDRFKIYCDKTYVVDPYMTSAIATQSYAQASNTIKMVKKYKKLNLEMIYNATNAGTVADINSGALYMVWIGSVAAGANTDMRARVSTRVRYIDG